MHTTTSQRVLLIRDCFCAHCTPAHEMQHEVRPYYSFFNICKHPRLHATIALLQVRATRHKLLRTEVLKPRKSYVAQFSSRKLKPHALLVSGGFVGRLHIEEVAEFIKMGLRSRGILVSVYSVFLLMGTTSRLCRNKWNCKLPCLEQPCHGSHNGRRFFTRKRRRRNKTSLCYLLGLGT